MASIYDVLKPVNSSMFSRAGYDDQNWKLVFEFKSTKEIRAYSGVSPEVADEAFAAESLGKWWNHMVKGNSSWEYEILGADPSQEQPKKTEPVEMTELDRDIQELCEPGWNGKEIVSQEELSKAHNEAVRSFETPAEVDRVDFYRRTPDADYKQIDGPVDTEPAALAKQTQGEVLAAWSAPDTATEALDLLAEHKTEIDALIVQNKTFGDLSMSVRVTDAVSHTGASSVLTALVESKDKSFKLLDPFRAVLYDAYQFAGERAKSAITPLEQAITHVKRSMLNWEQEQERLRQAKVREERERADAEARRQQAEQSQQMTLAEIDDALQAGDTEKAEQLAANPIETPLPYVAPRTVEPEYLAPVGQSTRANWKCDEEAANMGEFLLAVKSGKVDIAQAAKWVKFDFSALNKMAKSLQEAFSVPGVRAFNDPVKSVRRSK